MRPAVAGASKISEEPFIGLGCKAPEDRPADRTAGKWFDHTESEVEVLRELGTLGSKILSCDRAAEALQFAPQDRRLTREKVDPSAGVGVRLEALRIKDAVVLHMIAIDIVSLNDQRLTPQVTYIALYVLELSVSLILAGEGRHVQSENVWQ
jgi:hypothetical protein